jgi:hypothetical protein
MKPASSPNSGVGLSRFLSSVNARGALDGTEDAAECPGDVVFLRDPGGSGGGGGQDVALCEERPAVPDAAFGDADAGVEGFVALGGGAAARGERGGYEGGPGEGAFGAAPEVAGAEVVEVETALAGGEL